MKKKLFLAGAVLMMAAAAVTGYMMCNAAPSDLFDANVEALAEDEESGGGGSSCGYCHNGGVGATSCSIDGGIDIMGSGVSVACSVSCSGSYYACCSLRCICCS